MNTIDNFLFTVSALWPSHKTVYTLAPTATTTLCPGHDPDDDNDNVQTCKNFCIFQVFRLARLVRAAPRCNTMVQHLVIFLPFSGGDTYRPYTAI